MPLRTGAGHGRLHGVI